VVDRTSRTRKAPAAPEWVTTGQAATVLGVSSRTIVRLVKDGTLSARRLASGQFRLDLAEIEAYAASQTYVPDPDAQTPQPPKEDRQLKS